MRRIECPECGREVELDENNTVKTHDNVPPLRSVCRASRTDAGWLVAMLDKAIAAERERAAAELAALTAHVEAAIAEACAAVRARTIEECAARLDAERRRCDVQAEHSGHNDYDVRSDALEDMAEKLRALATPAPVTEPTPVDPAAGALR